MPRAPGSGRHFEESADFEFSFSPSLALIVLVRQFLFEFLSARFDQDSCERVSITTHELLENAFKYSAAAGIQIQIGIFLGCEVVPGAHAISIVVCNQSIPAHIHALSESIRQMREAPSGDAHYLARMRQTAETATGSGLGLARIVAENGMSINLSVDGTQVRLCATGAVRQKPLDGETR